MNRGKSRGRGRFGGSASPHSPADNRSHYNNGAEPSSSDRKERFSSGNQKSWQMKAVSKQEQPVDFVGQSCDRLSSRDNSACELNLEDLDNQAKIIGRDVIQSKESDMTPDSEHVSTISRERSWKSNQRPNNQKNTQWEDVTGWKEAIPTSYKVTLFGYGDNLRTAKSTVSGKGSANGPLNLDRSRMQNLETLKSSSSIEYAAHESIGGFETLKCDSSKKSEPAVAAGPFDICPPKDGGHELNPSLNLLNKEKRNQTECSLAPKAALLRSGMVLLKNYISVSEQANIVNECRTLGLGAGGFYQPGYRDGAKLSLKMMCLGKNWDPQTRSYDDIRPMDGAKPPPIPSSCFDLVKRSIKDSHTLIAEECGSTERVQAILPPVNPNICIVNFYATTGRLGLHQDRDESEASLRKGLPVVSISIGDDAEFLYGDQAEVEKAEKVILKSGDVLIFGGESRHVFHGVSSIKPDTAPKSLLHMTNLRAGRLNLTFREY